MILLIVGRFRDKSYCVLDLDSRQAKKCNEDAVRQYIKNGVVGNAHLFGNLIKGNYMSFSRLPYVEDMDKKPRKIVLCKARKDERDGYIVCTQDGKNIIWVSTGAILDYTHDFVNVSSYLSNQDKDAVSCKGYAFPKMRELLDKRKVQEMIEQEKVKNVASPQTIKNQDLSPMSNRPYTMQIDMEAIKAKRKMQLEAAAQDRVGRTIIPDTDISVNGKHSGAYALAYAKRNEAINKLNCDEPAPVESIDFNSILREYDENHK